MATAVTTLMGCLLTASLAYATQDDVGAFMVRGGGDTKYTGYGECITNECATYGDTGCLEEEPCASPANFSTSAQQFLVNTSGTIELYSGGSGTGECLDIKSNNPSLGELDLFTCDTNDTNAAQHWVYKTDFTNSYIGVLESIGHPGYCVDLDGDNMTSGTVIDIASCNGTYAQNWLPAYFSIQVQNYGMGECLQYDSFSALFYDNTCDSTNTAQWFSFQPSEIVSGYHGLMLYGADGIDWDVPGTASFIYPGTPSSSQGWWYYSYGLDADLTNAYNTTGGLPYDTLYDDGSSNVNEEEGWAGNTDSQWSFTILGLQ